MVDGVNNSNNANNIKYNKDLQTKTYLKNTCRNMSIFTKTSKINQKTFEAVNNRNENKDTINESDIKELKSAFNEGCEDAKTTTNEKGEQVTQCADGTSMTTFDNDATNTHSVSIGKIICINTYAMSICCIIIECCHTCSVSALCNLFTFFICCCFCIFTSFIKCR